jgi:hypothetical protein
MLRTNVSIYLTFYETILTCLSYVHQLYQFKNSRNHKLFNKKKRFCSNLLHEFAKELYEDCIQVYRNNKKLCEQ